MNHMPFVVNLSQQVTTLPRARPAVAESAGKMTAGRVRFSLAKMADCPSDIANLPPVLPGAYLPGLATITVCQNLTASATSSTVRANQRGILKLTVCVQHKNDASAIHKETCILNISNEKSVQAANTENLNSALMLPLVSG